MIQPLFKETNNNGPTTVYKRQRPHSTSVIYRDGGVFRQAPPHKGGQGWEHSGLDATRRLEELQSEFAEAPPIFISRCFYVFLSVLKTFAVTSVSGF